MPFGEGTSEGKGEELAAGVVDMQKRADEVRDAKLNIYESKGPVGKVMSAVQGEGRDAIAGEHKMRSEQAEGLAKNHMTEIQQAAIKEQKERLENKIKRLERQLNHLKHPGSAGFGPQADVAKFKADFQERFGVSTDDPSVIDADNYRAAVELGIVANPDPNEPLNPYYFLTTLKKIGYLGDRERLSQEIELKATEQLEKAKADLDATNQNLDLDAGDLAIPA